MKNCQVQNSRAPHLGFRFRKTDFENCSSWEKDNWVVEIERDF